MASKESCAIVGKHFICVESDDIQTSNSFSDWKWLSGIVYAVTDRDYTGIEDAQVCDLLQNCHLVDCTQQACVTVVFPGREHVYLADYLIMYIHVYSC